MKTFNKILLCTFALLITMNFITSKSNKIKLVNLEFEREAGKKVKYALKYENLSLSYNLANESDISSFNFGFNWTFSSEEEKQKGKTMVSELKADFDTVSADETQARIVFQAKDLVSQKLYKRNEFGSAIVLIVQQKGKQVQIQLQLTLEHEDNDDFEDLINKVVTKTSLRGVEGSFADSLQFLQ